jgi:hypothetical protein
MSQVLLVDSIEKSYQSRTLPLYDIISKTSRYIRRLHLQPGEAEAEIVCHLETVSLDDSPDYEALSYCWGNANDTREATCNRSRVSITHSLWNALRDLRSPNKVCILWGDGLCINQSDEDEKSHQVGMMGEIYRQARKVIVHLGSAKDCPEMSLAIDLMRRITAIDYEHWPFIDSNGVRQGRPYYDQDLLEKGLPSSEHPSWEALGMVLGRPWFGRAWVRQELLLAQDVDVYLGISWFPWSLLAEAVKRIFWVQNDTSILRSYSRPANYLQRAKAEFPQHEKKTLLDIIWGDFGSEVSDQRDRVFAYVSLAKNNSPSFEVDYTLSAAQVFTRFTLYCLKTYQNLDALDAVKDSEFTWTAIFPNIKNRLPVDTEVPSWVNNWSRQIGDRTQILKPFQQRFQASGEYRISIESADERHITLRGVKVDTIESIEEFLRDENWSGENSIPKEYMMLSSWERLIQGAKLVYGESACMVFFRTLLERPDLWSVAPSGDPWAFLSCWYQKFGRGNLLSSMQRRTDIRPEIVEQYAHIAQAMIHENSWMTRLFTTKRGYIGTTQRFSISVQAGDQVCLLYGGRYAYILRPREDGTYCFLGACYIEALIHGEGLEWPGIVEQSFALT